MLDAPAVDKLVADLIESSRQGDQARATGMNNSGGTFGSAEVLVAECLALQGLPADPQTVSRIRRAMAIPVSDRMKPLPGAIELLAEIHALGL